MKIHTSAGVTITPTVIDKNGNVRRKYKEASNMITDWGLNRVASTWWSNFLKYFLIGTGTNPTNRPTGAIELERSGNTVYASEDFFENDDVVFSRVLQFTDNQDTRVVGFTSAREILVEDALGDDTVLGGIIWNVEQELLDTYYMYTGTKDSTLPSSHGYYISDDATKVTITNWRSLKFDFTEDKVITEAGWSYYMDAARDLTKVFGRIVLPEPIEMLAGERLILKVKLTRQLPYGEVDSLGDGIFDVPGRIDVNEVINNGRGLGLSNSAGDIPNYHNGSDIAPLNAYGEMSYRCYTNKSTDFNVANRSGGYVHGSFEKIFSKYTHTAVMTGGINLVSIGDGSYHHIKFYPTDPIEIPVDSTVWMQVTVSWGRSLPRL